VRAICKHGRIVGPSEKAGAPMTWKQRKRIKQMQQAALRAGVRDKHGDAATRWLAEHRDDAPSEMVQWLEQHKPGTAQWINRRGGWAKLSPRAKRSISQQVREAKRAMSKWK
jgi:hypothetical protein